MAGEDEKKKVAAEKKMGRRNAKSSFTRCTSSLEGFIAANRTAQEIQEVFETLKAKFTKVESAHEEYCALLDDEYFNTEQKWMDEIEDKFYQLKCKANDMIAKQPVEDVVSSPQPSKDHDAPVVKPQIHTEKIPIPEFDGKIDNFLLFRRDWRKIVEPRYGKSDDALYLLNRKVCEEARNWIVGKTSYTDAWAILDEIYGDARRVSDSLIAEIEQFKPLNENDPRLTSLYHLVQKALNILQQRNRRSDLDNSTTLGMIERKLCMHDRVKWAEHQREKDVEPSIDTFLKWLADRLWIRRTAFAGIRNTSSKSAGSVLSVSEVHHDNLIDSERVATKPLQPSTPKEALVQQEQSSKQPKHKRCWYCEKTEHQVVDCACFKNLTPDERFHEVNKQSACYFCLRKHRFPCMAKRKRCPHKQNADPCRYYHHPLLHGADFTNRGTSNCVGSGQKLLPIVSQQVGNSQQDDWLTANILLDSGSDFCLIRNGFAQKLGLVGEQDRLNFIIASGQSINKPCMAYTVEITGTDGKVYSVRAKGIEKITDDASLVDMKQIAEKFGVAETQIARKSGPIDILLGIDYVQFHAGETVTIDNLAFRDTCIGPVIFGVSPHQDRYRNGSINNIVERFDLEHSWSTESNGVVNKNVETGEIQTKAAVNDLEHLPSQSNVADDTSRDLKASELNIRSIPGPEFRHLPEDQWPASSSQTADFIEDHDTAMAILSKKARTKVNVDKLSDFRQLSKVIRVLAITILFGIILQAMAQPHIDQNDQKIYSIKISLNETQNYWGVLFMCLSTRSLYGDVAVDNFPMEFLQSFRRFITIRGCPSSVMSDNGSQLVCAAKDITNWCSVREINWYLTTPTAAHQNVCAESLVKSVKKAMASIMKHIKHWLRCNFIQSHSCLERSYPRQ